MATNTLSNSYKNFNVISVRQIPDCNSTGIYLRHKKTGLEVFHLLNDDEENLFAFAFRTPIKNSTGAAHIMEHSVFCGSKNFPLKEPFTNMMNQSVNTFLNAMTYSDKTVYPASSTVRADYFNLFNVYGDAVFFPLLKKEAFLQEAHRLEIDDNGKFSIQGVVYNEMKGNYSSFDSVANDEQLRSLFLDSNYNYDSGGDPLEIPSFSYEDFKTFHKKYYRPDNCLVFLYGNIPTEEQLDFLQDKFLDELENLYSAPENKSQTPIVPKEFTLLEQSKDIEKPVFITKEAPNTGATGSNATVNWICGKTSDLKSYIECAFLTEVLAGHDGSPLTKILIESNLGDDLTMTGAINETEEFFITFGLHGVKKHNCKKVFSLIDKTLQDLAQNGIDKNHIDSALMSAEISNREVVRSGGPFSLVLLDRVLNGWNYGSSPDEMFFFRDAIEDIRKTLESDDSYVQKLINKYLLKNNKKVYMVVNPSKNYLHKRDKQEKALIKKLSKAIDTSLVKKDLELLHAYQNHHETEEETACIPSLSLSDLKSYKESSKTEIKKLASDGKGISIFYNTENTNGIGYLTVCFPLDVIKEEDYPYLTLYSYCATNIGWNNKSWSECSEETAIHTGGIYTKLVSASPSHTEEAEKLRESLKEHNCTDRDWLMFTVRFINEKTEDALNVLSDNLAGLKFNDAKRIKTLLGEAVSAIKSSVIPKGNRYALKRAQCVQSHSGIVDELFNGLSQLFFLSKLSNENPEELLPIFERISNTLFDAGAIIHVTADESTMQNIDKSLLNFVKNAKLKPICKKNPIDETKLKELLKLPGEENGLPDTELFKIDSQVGFAASSFCGSAFGSKENPSELTLSHWLSGNLLWERIRTAGGAYGAYAGSANLSGSFNISTFRDPTPEKSCETFIECLTDTANGKVIISDEECKRNVIGTYGDETQPQSPHSRGYSAFFRKLYCITDYDRKQKLDRLLEVRPADLRETAKRILSSQDKSRTAIIENKTIKNASVIINLPL